VARDLPIEKLLRELGFHTPTSQLAARAALEEAGITRSGKGRIAEWKRDEAAAAIAARITLVCSACREAGLDAATVRALRPALDRKDEAAVRALARSDGAAPGHLDPAAAALLVALLRAAGPAETALPALAALDLPSQARAEADRLTQVVAILHEAAPGLRLTVDPVENRNFEYHTGLSFSLFVRGLQGEIGRGGRYRANREEPATGFTLFMDAVMGAVPPPEPARRIWLPLGIPAAEARRLRREGWVTVTALAPVVDPAAEARRLRCGHHYRDGTAVPLS
jgi:ATP phosphoribosyltransferase regulatory subunit